MGVGTVCHGPKAQGEQNDDHWIYDSWSWHGKYATHRIKAEVIASISLSIWTSPASSVLAVTLRWSRNVLGTTGTWHDFTFSFPDLARFFALPDPIGGNAVNFFRSPSDLESLRIASSFEFLFFIASSAMSFSVMVNKCFCSSCLVNHSWSFMLYSSINVSSVIWWNSEWKWWLFVKLSTLDSS